MASQTSVQDVVHSLEHGFLGTIVRLALILAVVTAVALIYLFRDFRGLGTMEGMDQAQVAREIAKGNGFTTKVIRPLALWRLEKAHGTRDFEGKMPELYHGPLQPLVNSVPLGLFKNAWAVPPKDQSKGFVFTQDRVIAATSMLFLLLATILTYVIARSLFDKLVAGLAAAIVLVTDGLWQYTLTGLPQMLMLFLLSGAVFAVYKAIHASINVGRPAVWMAIAGVLFGLLTLAHGVGAFIFLGALVFAAVYFRPRGVMMLWMLGFFLLIVVPWCYRNMNIMGNPFGIAYYAATDGIGGSEWRHMRSLNGPDLPNVGAQHYFNKIRGGLVGQVSSLTTLFCGCVVAPLFFISLLHPFRRPETGALRWLLGAMWVTGAIGMSVLGVKTSEQVSPNNFHVLFLPLFTIYGLAFLIILWNRTDIEIKLLKYGFLVIIVLLCAGSFILQMLPTQKPKIHWPPYWPNFIAKIGGEKGWMREGELLCSDQPWAVAWYADRDCVWLPTTIKDFYELNDMRRIAKKPISGLFLTPITSDQPFVSGLLRGENKDWLPLATRSQFPPSFPLTQPLAIPVLDRLFPDLLFLADTRRWEEGTQENISPAIQEERERAMKEGLPPEDLEQKSNATTPAAGDGSAPANSAAPSTPSQNQAQPQ